MIFISFRTLLLAYWAITLALPFMAHGFIIEHEVVTYDPLEAHIFADCSYTEDEMALLNEVDIDLSKQLFDFFQYGSKTGLAYQGIAGQDSTSDGTPEEPDDGRDAAIFGDFNATTPSLGGRDDTIFGEETPVEPSRDAAILENPAAKVEKRLAASSLLQDKLSIGGLLQLRLDYYALEDGTVEDFSLRSPNLLDIYLDARPNTHVRAYTNFRVAHDSTVTEGEIDAYGRELQRTEWLLDQLWLKFDKRQSLFLTVGQQRIKWGVGRFWNPTDFINKRRRDPLAVFDERTGVNLIKLHYPVESLGWNFYAIADIDEASTADRVGGALRGEFVAGPAEMALSANVRREEPVRLGADISAGVGDFDLRAEAAFSRRVETPFYRGTFDPSTLQFPEAYSRKDEWIPQVTLGAELSVKYSDQDSVVFGGEFFFNDAGYDLPDLYPWLAVNNAYESFYLGRQYAAGYVVLLYPGNWDNTHIVLSALTNISDRSWVLRLDHRVTVLTYLHVDSYTAWHFGENGEFHYALEVPPVPAIPELSNGLDVSALFLDVGIRLSVAI